MIFCCDHCDKETEQDSYLHTWVNEQLCEDCLEEIGHDGELPCGECLRINQEHFGGGTGYDM